MDRFVSYPCDEISHVRAGQNGVSARITGDNSYWILEDVRFNKRFIQVTMKVEPDEIKEGKYYHCKLYFQEHGMNSFDEDHSLTVAIKAFNEYHKYIFKCIPFQNKSIKKLLFKPLNHPGMVYISKFQLNDYIQPDMSDSLMMRKETLDFLFMSYFSRSGSTLAMKILTRHPQITGYTQGTHETHILRYFSKLYYMFETSHIYSGDLSKSPFLSRLDSLREFYASETFLPKPFEFSPYMNLTLFKKHYSKFIREYLPQLLSDMNLESVSTAKYYIEKHLDYGCFEFSRTLIDMFPSSKVVAIFRDPRDVFLSLYEFYKKEKILKPNLSSEDHIRRIMDDYVARLKFLGDITDSGFSFRYEDLLSRPEATICSVLKFLGIDSSDKIIDDLLFPLHKRDLQASRHMTAENLEKTVNRWKSELRDDHKKVFEEYPEVFESLVYEI